MTPMHAACLSGNKLILRILLDHGAVHKIDKKRFMPLHYAIVKDHTHIVEFLHQGRENPSRMDVLDESNKCREYSLMTLAIQNGAYGVIKKLIEFGADPHERDQEGFNYLHMAAISGHVNIFLYFMSKQVNIKALNNAGKSPL